MPSVVIFAVTKDEGVLVVNEPKDQTEEMVLKLPEYDHFSFKKPDSNLFLWNLIRRNFSKAGYKPEKMVKLGNIFYSRHKEIAGNRVMSFDPWLIFIEKKKTKTPEKSPLLIMPLDKLFKLIWQGEITDENSFITICLALEERFRNMAANRKH